MVNATSRLEKVKKYFSERLHIGWQRDSCTSDGIGGKHQETGRLDVKLSTHLLHRNISILGGYNTTGDDPLALSCYF